MLCSQTLSERAVRVYIGAEEDLKPEMWHQSASARPARDVVVLDSVCTDVRAVTIIVMVASECMLVTQRCLCRSAHTVVSAYTRF